MRQDDPYGLAQFGAELAGAKLYKTEKRLVAQLRLARLIGAREAERIAAQLGAAVPDCTVELRCAENAETLLAEAALPAVLAESWAHFSPLMRPVLRNAVWEREEQHGCAFAVRIPEKLYEAAKTYNGATRLTEFVQTLYGSALQVRLVPDANLAMPSPERAEEPPSPAARADRPQAENARRPEPQKNASTKKPAPARGGAKRAVIPKDAVLLGTPTGTKLVPMQEVNEESGAVTVQGEILSLDVRTRRDESFIVVLYLSDKTGTLPLKLFLRKEEKGVVERIEKCRKDGKWLVAHGRYARDDFMSMHCVFPNWLYLTEPIRREDKAEHKRVELHLHTKMSSMDGLVDPKEAITTAARWGHKAVAITDHGVVQAFPAVVAAADKLAKDGKDFKAILGVEGYLLPDCALIPMEGAFCVVGLTLGGGVRKDSVFEIAAVRYAPDRAEERFHTLVNPAVPLPHALAAEMDVAQEQIDAAPLLSEALQALTEFARGAHLVFHGAETLLPLWKKAQELSIEMPAQCVNTEMLTHYLFRELKDTGLRAACAAAGAAEPGIGAAAQADAVRALLAALCARMRERNVQRLPLTDFVPRERVKGQRSTFHIILIAKNHEGLKNLYRLVSYSHLEHLRGVPRIPRSLLQMHREGIIVGSACEAGELFQAILAEKPHVEIVETAKEYDYLEIQPIGNNAFMVRNETVKDDEGLRELNRKIVTLGEELGIPVVATGDVHFLNPEDAIYRAILMSARDFKDAEQQAPLYFKTTDEMLAEFSYLGEEKAFEVVVTNPNAIADSCDRLKAFLSEKGTYAPTFEGANEELRGMAEKRAHEIYGDPLPEVVQARLEKELNSIIGNGYATLYLLAQRLVHKSNSDGYLVGSRGSVGSSFVATMAGITEVNPLQPHYVCPNCKHSDFDVDRTKYACGVDMPDANCPVCGTKYQKLGYEIPFEVFLGFKGDKTPDIDLNFSGEYQPVAHKYVEEMFGEGHAFRAGTISGLQDKTIYGYIKGYCEQQGVTFNRGETERLVAGCVGVKRTTGQHPGGIVIVPQENDIIEFSPVQYPADKKEKNTITTHFDFHAMDDRLVKLDILGHDDPTALRMMQDVTGLDPKDIPLDDPETMKIFRSIEPLGITLEELECDVGSIAIPEFGTNFVRKMLMDTRPTTMEELVRLAGLSHGTDVWLGNAQDLVLSGQATLSQVICTRDDIMNYLILRGGEPLMSFKTMESVRKGRGLTPEMEEHMQKINTPEWFVTSCKKIKYMFPRAHAAAYVMMAFRVAYYKVHLPLAFYSVYFTVRADAFDVAQASGGAERVLKNIKALKAKGNEIETKEADLLVILEVVYEMNLRGIELLPVDLTHSKATRFVIEGNAIRPPFSSIAGVGTNAAIGIEEAQSGGPFGSVEDFRARTKANSAVITAMRALGCFDGMPETNQLTLF